LAYDRLAAMKCFSALRVFTVGICLVSLMWLPAVAQDAAPSISSGTHEDPIRILADWTVKEAASVGCKPGECELLVTNFRMPDDVNGALGVQLADELSGKIADTQKEIQVFNRDLFKSYLDANHPSAEMLKSDQSIGSLANQLGATALVAATAVRVHGDTFRVSVRLMNAKDESLAITTEVSVTRRVPLEKLTPTSQSVDPKRVAHPSCYYMPNPPYSEKARAADFNGKVPVEAIIQVDGTLAGLRILKSPGMGLDELLLDTMQKWKCHPATTENGPIAVKVQFQIEYRLMR
jgi:TonB family protein